MVEMGRRERASSVLAGRTGAQMIDALKKIPASGGAIAGRQRNAWLGSLSRVSPLRLARRLLAAGDADRQRIERDLHDGIQLRLTGLRIRLAVAAEGFQGQGDTDASAALHRFGEEVQQAIDAIRDFAR